MGEKCRFKAKIQFSRSINNIKNQVIVRKITWMGRVQKIISNSLWWSRKIQRKKQFIRLIIKKNNKRVIIWKINNE